MLVSFTFTEHNGIIFQLGYDSGHISKPFSPLFYPHRSEYPVPFHLMWPRIKNQKVFDPVWANHMTNPHTRDKVHITEV